MSLAALVAAAPVLGDGGLGTALLARGLTAGEPAEGWVLTRPDDVQAVQAAFVAAGTQALQTHTFGANRARLDHHGLGDQTVALNRRAVELARAVGPRWVVGGLGPSSLPADTPHDAVRAVFAEQAQALADAGVDWLLVETMTNQAEARCALAAARATGLDVVVSLAVDDALQTFGDGIPLATSLAALRDDGAAALGVNCVASPLALQALPALRAAGLPVWLAPNAGVPAVTDGRLRYPQGPAAYAQDMARAAAEGAALLGGCCGVGPTHTAALAEALA